MTTRRRGLVAACDDKRLINVELFPLQRELLAAVERERLSVWCLGRRSGKSMMGAAVLVWDALLRPQLADALRPGERRYSVAVATNQKQARIVIHHALSFVKKSPLLEAMIETATADEILFKNGTAIAAFPASSRGGRGWPISALMLDEAAHHFDTEGNASALQVWRAFSPSVAQFGSEARIIVSSTPVGTEGWFAETFHRASNGEIPKAVAFRYPTWQMNLLITAEDLEVERASDPEGFRSEFGAEFLGGGGAYLDPERVRGAVVLPGELLPDQADRWIAGLDPAFSSDPFGLALVGQHRSDWRTLVLGRAQAWEPRGGSQSHDEHEAFKDDRLDEVADVCLRYNARVVTDQYAARHVLDRLRGKGLNVTVVQMTAASKTEAFGELRARLNSSTLELYDHPDLLAQLRRLRTRYSAGSASVVNPRVGGSHGDMAQALALAVWAHKDSSDPNELAEIHWEDTYLSDLHWSTRPPSDDDPL